MDRAMHSPCNAKNLTSVLNGTKWDRLFRALEEIRDSLDFRRKDIRDGFSDAPAWESDIYHVFGLSQFIEWVEIRSADSRKLIDTIRLAGIPFEKVETGVRVYGYLRPGCAPAWAE